MSKTCECGKTSREKAQDAVGMALDSYNYMKHEVMSAEGLTYVPKAIWGLMTVAYHLIDAVGYLAHEKPKSRSKK